MLPEKESFDAESARSLEEEIPSDYDDDQDIDEDFDQEDHEANVLFSRPDPIARAENDADREVAGSSLAPQHLGIMSLQQVIGPIRRMMMMPLMLRPLSQEPIPVYHHLADDGRKSLKLCQTVNLLHIQILPSIRYAHHLMHFLNFLMKK